MSDAIVADKGDPGKPCGDAVGLKFAEEAGAHWASVLNACEIKGSFIACDTAYLPESEKVFVRLRYRHAGEKYLLMLAVLRRSKNGSLTPFVMPSEKQKRAVELWLKLRFIASSCPSSQK